MTYRACRHGAASSWPVVARSLILATLVCSATAVSTVSANENGVAALGRLEPEHGIIHVASASMPEAILGAILTELYVEEGDDVRKGDLLAVTDTAPVLQAGIDQVQAELAFRQRDVQAAISDSEEACVRADVAAREAERRVELASRGLAGEEESESARGEAEAQAASCATSKTAIDLKRAAVRVAEATLARAKAEFQRAHVYAPRDGRVLHITRRPGELLGEAGVLELGAVHRMFAVAEVYETDISRVKTGQRATVSSPALASDLEGEVTHIGQKVAKQDEIGTDPAARKDARIVEVFILLDNPESTKSLTNLQVDIVIHP